MFATLNTWWEGDFFLFSFEGQHFHLTSIGRFGKRNWQININIIPFAFKITVFFNLKKHLNISLSSSVSTIVSHFGVEITPISFNSRRNYKLSFNFLENKFL